MPIEPAPIAAQVIDRASEWFVLMREPSVSTQEREAFSAWLRESPVHVGAYLEIAKLWGDAAHVSPLFEVAGASEQFANVRTLPVGDKLDAIMPLRGDTASNAANQRHFRGLKLVACAVIAGAIGLGVWLSSDRAPTYSAGIGEQRMITLDDGSIVRLDSRSKIAVRFSRSERNIDLHEGQALFQVAHDTSRPFIVNGREVAIRAVGTQFNVNNLRADTVVIVVEGRVRVGGLVPVRAGEQATIDRSGHIAVQPDVDVSAATSWLQHELSFRGSPLSEVVEEFNRYNRTPIIITDAALGETRVNAVFHSTDSASLLRFISRLEGVKVERSRDDVRIYRNP
jgi:transmembrane sensor